MFSSHPDFSTRCDSAVKPPNWSSPWVERFAGDQTATTTSQGRGAKWQKSKWMLSDCEQGGGL